MVLDLYSLIYVVILVVLGFVVVPSIFRRESRRNWFGLAFVLSGLLALVIFSSLQGYGHQESIYEVEDSEVTGEVCPVSGRVIEGGGELLDKLEDYINEQDIARDDSVMYLLEHLEGSRQ